MINYESFNLLYFHKMASKFIILILLLPFIVHAESGVHMSERECRVFIDFTYYNLMGLAKTGLVSRLH